MNFEPDDLDWAMGELLHLFARARQRGAFPHRLNPTLFHSAWTVLCMQPFPVRERCHFILMDGQRAFSLPNFHGLSGTRYENARTA
jgi:hypothetical protein